MMVSERRRRLRYLRDESELYNSLQDDETRAELARAMRATAARYAEIADMTHVERLQRQARAALPIGGTLIFVGLTLQLVAWMSAQEITWFFTSGLGVMAVGTGLWSLTYSRLTFAKADRKFWHLSRKYGR